MGVPLIVVPVSPVNVLWMLVEPLVFRILDSLPFRFKSFDRYGRRGWHFIDKSASHIEYGNAWALVTPCEIFLSICDPNAINEIFARRPDFERPVQLYQPLAVYGPNVITVRWEDWQRHRKIIAAPFNEKMNKFVWSESLCQARDMIQAWTRCDQSGNGDVAKDTRTLSLNVLAATGFQKSYRFRACTETVQEEGRNYRESLATTLDNAIFLMLFSPKLLAIPLIPKSWARIGQATKDFKEYMMDMFSEEKRLLAAGKTGTGNLMSSMVRATGVEQQSSKDKAGRPQGLTINEILGNIFLINFAGHDTTANTLAYSMLLLAAYPEVQDWIGEEVRSIFEDSNSETWDYEKLFSRLKRCHAVLLETVRLYPPIMALPKYTCHHSQTLSVDNKTIVIPPETFVVPSLLAIQTHPRHWKDPLVWRPSRWINPRSDSSHSLTDTAVKLWHEELVIPDRGTYFPWSFGPQKCPGEKFSQVEFVAVVSCLFYTHRAHISRAKGESFENARERVLAVCDDSEHGLLLRMRHADDVRLVWKHL